MALVVSLRGSDALTPARLERLRRRLGGVQRLRATSLFLAELERPLEPEEGTRLARLVDAEMPFLATAEESESDSTPRGWVRLVRLVAPRVGTISPWSSKATDIVRNAGLDAVLRIERATVFTLWLTADSPLALEPLFDPMTEAVFERESELHVLFHHAAPRPLEVVRLGHDGASALARANEALGLALSSAELAHLCRSYEALGRDPTDVELMMFAQANSEHCRHKIFKARFVVDGEPQPHSLFEMIQNTHRCSPEGVLSAYRDNAAVMEGQLGKVLCVSPATGAYEEREQWAHVLMKCETHNHPTAISPYPGAATGSGGEIRDEAATGRGAQPKAGLTGFSVSNLRIPGWEQPWEQQDYGRPRAIRSALDIMIEAPLGAAAFNNEFGRPGIIGYFRTFEQTVPVAGTAERRGYHKPIMLAGGLGNVQPSLVHKAPIQPGHLLVVLGGPAFLIGLGGGSASSRVSSSAQASLDFASVQRDNPEMQRRCQEVITACNALGDATPIVSVHDVGAGGLSNALPELVAEHGLGASFELRDIPTADRGLSPLELWCNEAQERFVLGIDPERWASFEAIARRERCPFAVVGRARAERQLTVGDRFQGQAPVDVPLDLLFGSLPRLEIDAQRRAAPEAPLDLSAVSLPEAALRVLRLPTVADKSFLVTIGDRTVSGLVSRDSMVGPWQVPVADAAVTLTDYVGYGGEAMAIGERAPVALIDAARSARLAVAEAITNICSAPVGTLSKVRLSANWMAAAGHPGEAAALFDAVRAVGLELCPALGIAIPVGKDSLSMRSAWTDERGESRSVVSPLSLVVSAFASLGDVRGALTPQLAEGQDTELLLIDLGGGRDRLGGSALAQVYSQLGVDAPDLEDPAILRDFFDVVQSLMAEGVLLAYHDRSDGGLWTTLLEMAFAAHRGLDIELDVGASDPRAALFSEELGAVVQVRRADASRVVERAAQTASGRLGKLRVLSIGRPRQDDRIVVLHHGRVLLSEARSVLQSTWSESSFRMASLRDNPDCAREQFERLREADYPGLRAKVPAGLTIDAEALSATNAGAPDALGRTANVSRGKRPRLAILREQGVNGQREMAAAFMQAGFDCFDVTMTDLHEGRVDLAHFAMFVACGGFSYGDVLGAGQGWAKSILFQPRLRQAFAKFFARPETLALGVCNGCQMLSALRELIPGGEAIPTFRQNKSERFEARLSLVRVEASPSPLLVDLVGAELPVAVSHGEGRADFTSGQYSAAERDRTVVMRYLDHRGSPTDRYPENPNGSEHAVAGVTSTSGRVTLMMPHPERVFRSVQLSYCPPGFGQFTPWMRLFENARRWLAQ